MPVTKLPPAPELSEEWTLRIANAASHDEAIALVQSDDFPADARETGYHLAGVWHAPEGAPSPAARSLPRAR